MSFSRIGVFVIAVGLLGAAIVLPFSFGYTVGRYELPPYDFVNRVDYKLRSMFRTDAIYEPQTTYYESIFLRLQGEMASVRVARPGRGGGLTSLGDTVLLLTYNGQIFSAKSADDIQETAIQTPDNGFSAFQRAAENAEGAAIYDLTRLRYNDIVYFGSELGQGLAISYTEYDREQDCFQTAIAVLMLDPNIEEPGQIRARGEDWDVVYRTKPCLPLNEQGSAIAGHMAGGRMAFEAPRTIYLTSGTYGWDGPATDGSSAETSSAQDPQMDYGKVLAVDLATSEAEVISIGHRNPQGIVLDPNGRLWVVEHGPRGGDELNQVVEGANFGWPEEALGTLYSTLPLPRDRAYGRHEFFNPPVFAWLPSIGISNVDLIEGFHESWDGDLLAASLNGLSLHRLRVQNGRVLFAEKIDIGKRIRYVHQHNDGHLVLWTDDNYLIFLTVAETGFATAFVEEFIEEAGYDDEQRPQVAAAVHSCMECHSFEPGVHTGAPSLSSIFGTPIGDTTFDGYSQALRAAGGDWTREELMAFLQDPEAYTPGTLMPDPAIDDPFVLGEVVDLLEAVTTTAQGPGAE